MVTLERHPLGRSLRITLSPTSGLKLIVIECWFRVLKQPISEFVDHRKEALTPLSLKENSKDAFGENQMCRNQLKLDPKSVTHDLRSDQTSKNLADFVASSL